MSGVPSAPADRGRPTGFALPVAIFALVTVAVLATGGIFTARQEAQIGRSTAQARHALYRTEHAIAEVVREWDWADAWSWPVGAADSTEGTLPGAVYTAVRTRLSPSLFFVDVTGTVTTGGRYGGATRRIGVLTRMRTATMEPRSAVLARGNLTVGGNSGISGFDESPSDPAGTNWGAECEAFEAGDTLPGILMNDTLRVDTVSTSPLEVDTVGLTREGRSHSVEGEPAVAEDPTVSDDDFFTYGDLTWDDLVRLASKVYPPDAPDVTNTEPAYAGGACDTSVQSNWGEPTDPEDACFDYFPLIYAEGDLTVNSSAYGQGILLVEGDLEMKGGYSFYGVVIVRGTLLTEGTGAHINGAVLASNAELGENRVAGRAQIQYSSCAVRRSVLHNRDLTRAQLLSQRSWVDLSALLE